MAATPPKHFSMIREFHLADFLTLANAASGLGAVLFSMLYMGNQSPAYFFAATAMTPAALVFDWLDGRVARWRRKHSALGRELDSLADIISFGVAPAGTRIRRRHARGVGLGRADLFRLLRGQPTGPVQRDRGEPLGGRGQVWPTSKAPPFPRPCC